MAQALGASLRHHRGASPRWLLPAAAHQAWCHSGWRLRAAQSPALTDLEGTYAYGRFLSSHMMGMWQYTSMGSVSPASTAILKGKTRVRGRSRAGAAGPGLLHLPLLALVDELLHLLHAAADLLVLGRCKRGNASGGCANRPGPARSQALGPSPRPPRFPRCLPPSPSRTFPNALVELPRQLAGGERLRDGVEVPELLPVRQLRGRLRRLRLLLPRHSLALPPATSASGARAARPPRAERQPMGARPASARPPPRPMASRARPPVRPVLPQCSQCPQYCYSSQCLQCSQCSSCRAPKESQCSQCCPSAPPVPPVLLELPVLPVLFGAGPPVLPVPPSPHSAAPVLPVPPKFPQCSQRAQCPHYS